ncbi:TPA: coiled-coil domain-containing protein, partial [Enterococcus faecium]
QILTTQDIIFFSLGVSDISQGQADEYVSQLEELIQKYNETFDAFMAEIKGRVDSLNQQINDLTGQAKTLQDKLDALKEEIAKLGNLFVMYSNSVDFDDTGEYKYRGIGMRDSKNLEDFVWDLAPKYVEENLATESKVTEIIGEANKYTDNSIEAVNINVTNIADDLAKQINVNENAARNYTDTKKIEAVNESKKYTDEVFRKEIVNLTVKNGNLGTARLYRQGNCVTIYFFDLNGRNSGGNDSVILTVPEGYRTPISFEQLVGST